MLAEKIMIAIILLVALFPLVHTLVEYVKKRLIYHLPKVRVRVTASDSYVMYSENDEYVVNQLENHISGVFDVDERRIEKNALVFAVKPEIERVFEENYEGETFEAYYSAKKDKLYRCSDYKPDRSEIGNLISRMVLYIAMVSFILPFVMVIFNGGELQTDENSTRRIMAMLVIPFMLVIVNMIFGSVMEMVQIARKNSRLKKAFDEGKVKALNGNFIGYHKVKHTYRTGSNNHHHTYYTYHPVIVYVDNGKKYYFTAEDSSRTKEQYQYNQQTTLYELNETGEKVLTMPESKDQISIAVVLISLLPLFFILYVLLKGFFGL